MASAWTIQGPWQSIKEVPVGESNAGRTVVEDRTEGDEVPGGEPMNAPRKDRVPQRPDNRDASDVVEGDIGEARLREPGDGDAGADLDKLQDVVEVQTKQQEGEG
jgi:hypothetical protein